MLCSVWGEYIFDYLEWAEVDYRKATKWKSMSIVPPEYNVEQFPLESLLMLYKLNLDIDDKLLWYPSTTRNYLIKYTYKVMVSPYPS